MSSVMENFVLIQKIKVKIKKMMRENQVMGNQ